MIEGVSRLSFQHQMSKIAQQYEARGRELARAVNAHIGRSIIEGSAVTGAPGQPVDKYKLKPSWYSRPVGKDSIMWLSNVPYARIIEENARGARLRSAVGGFHSLMYTRHGFQAIVRHELAYLKANPLRYDQALNRFRDTRNRFQVGPK